jgi:hypothetical protein
MVWEIRALLQQVQGTLQGFYLEALRKNQPVLDIQKCIDSGKDILKTLAEVVDISAKLSAVPDNADALLAIEKILGQTKALKAMAGLREKEAANLVTSARQTFT